MYRDDLEDLNKYADDVLGHLSDATLLLARISRIQDKLNLGSSFSNHAINVLNNIYQQLEIMPKNNPALVAKPLKTAKKLKWWAIGLLEKDKNLVKRVVTQFRTKTEAKLFARSALQKHAQGFLIEYALVEGPFISMSEAQTAQLLFPEE